LEIADQSIGEGIVESSVATATDNDFSDIATNGLVKALSKWFPLIAEEPLVSTACSGSVAARQNTQCDL
jgi:hypothetical protein